ncbi:MAG: tetratricopeptide repeat protein [Gammaproteobacteria bacterium]|jgi:tetratricopeptide (TPR) repeat protein
MFSFTLLKARNTSVLFSALLLAACAGIQPEPADAPEAVAETEKQNEAEAVVKQVPPPKPERVIPKRPDIDLTEDILFKVLLAEIAGQRGELDVAIENYLDLARTTRDPLVVERAARVAIYAREDEAAFEAAQLWVELDPKNPDAHQVLTIMTMRQGNIEQSLKHLEIIMESSNGELDQKLWMIANFLGREEDKTGVMLLMERLMENHMDDADAIFAYANVSARMGDMERAKGLLKRVIELKPNNEAAALTYIALLQKAGESNVAIEWLEARIKNADVSFNIRITYARLLTEVKRFEDARGQFEILAEQEPTNVDVLYALGLLYLQTNKLEDAEKQFIKLSELKKRVFDSNYYLGRIAEEKNELEKASGLYQGVHGGENYFDARIRLSLILAKQGEIEKALGNIRSIQKAKGSNRLILTQAEGEILIGEKRYQEALTVFNTAIEEQTHPDLLYSRAMLAEKMDRLDILEADLRAILAEDEDNATALNALGYTLADKTDRYEEAYKYIKRAYELSPGDFYILDSMGWVLYRMGRLDEAVDFLQQAFELRKDPEIAAHLGEVFWVMGKKEAAKEVWETALQGTPTDDTLLEVIERFKP